MDRCLNLEQRQRVSTCVNLFHQMKYSFNICDCLHFVKMAANNSFGRATFPSDWADIRRDEHFLCDHTCDFEHVRMRRTRIVVTHLACNAGFLIRSSNYMLSALLSSQEHCTPIGGNITLCASMNFEFLSLPLHR